MIFEFIIITILYLIGVGFDAMAKVKKFKKLFPKLKFKEIWHTYFVEEWDSLITSGLGLFVIQIAWVLLHKNKVPLPAWMHDYGGIFGIALLSGYALQRLIYKALGTAEGVLEKKNDAVANRQ